MIMHTLPSNYLMVLKKLKEHPGYMGEDKIGYFYLLQLSAQAMSDFICHNGCLITQRHDLPQQAELTSDYLLNIMTETVVLHIYINGTVSLHHWEKMTPCAFNNQLPVEKTDYLLESLDLAMLTPAPQQYFSYQAPQYTH